MKLYLKPVLPLALLGALAACGTETPVGSADPHAEEISEQKGPKGGKLLSEGNFDLELTIYETGQDPEFRIYAYEDGKPIVLKDLNATVTLKRLGGRKDVFEFTSEGDYLAGDGVVGEPHSFDVEIQANYKGRSFRWAYENYEGRTVISPKMAAIAGIETMEAGPAEIEETLDILGQVEFAPSAQSILRARYPGKVMQVLKAEGEPVKKGEVLARIESNESLQSYKITSPMDGVVVRSHTRVGDVVNDGELFIIGDVTNLWADFHIYPRDMLHVKPGQKVTIEPIGGGFSQVIELDEYLPATEPNSQTLTIHAPFQNPEKLWLPGMKIKGTVVTRKGNRAACGEN